MTTTEPVDPLPQIDDGAATAIVLDVLAKESELRRECYEEMIAERNRRLGLSPIRTVGIRLMKFAIRKETQTQRDLLKAMTARKGINWAQVLAELRKETRPC